MQSDKENQREIYFSDSEKNIDDFIERNNYKAAFGLLIMVLERLEENEKKKSSIIIAKI